MRTVIRATPMGLLLLACSAAAQPQAAETAKAAMQAGNYAEAYCLWRTLADRNDAEAQYNLGWMYHNGYGLAINDQTAAGWWELAASKDHADALFALGNLYRFGGRGVDQDGSRAVDYFLRAARGGDEDAALLLRSLIAKNDRIVRERIPELLTRHREALAATLRIRVDRVNLRKGAGTDHAVLGVMVRGAELIELSRRGEWVQVGDPSSGQVGWLKSSSLEK
jgi:uncharacterized protein YgiM (DUF1202 family)